MNKINRFCFIQPSYRFNGKCVANRFRITKPREIFSLFKTIYGGTWRFFDSEMWRMWPLDFKKNFFFFFSYRKIKIQDWLK